jgi:hypothetical protein
MVVLGYLQAPIFARSYAMSVVNPAYYHDIEHQQHHFDT